MKYSAEYRWASWLGCFIWRRLHSRESCRLQSFSNGARAMNARTDGSHQTEWDRIAASERFQDLLALKKAFIIPVFVFFFVYYFVLPISIGYAPKLMSIRVIGTVTLAYLFALSQFVVGWIIAWLYVKAAAKFDTLAKDILREVDDEQGGK
jgi:uncharacterized membrane protein (DUF485 family)